MGGGGKNSASGAEQTALNNQSQLNNQVLGQANQLASTNSQYYQPLLQGLSTDYGAISGNGTLGQNISSGLNSATAAGGNQAYATGVNSNMGLQQLTKYASQPQNTNLNQVNQGQQSFYGGLASGGGAVGQVTPGLQQYYQNEQNTGINQQYAQNAQNQLGQANQQGLQQIMQNAAPGTNQNALLQNLQSGFLQNSANLQGNLAGQSQTFANQGAQGVAGTAANLLNSQTQGIQGQANTASNLDTQKLGLLQAGNTAGQQGNTQSLQNLLATLTQGQNSLNSSDTFMQQGTSNVQQAMNALAGLSQQNANMATQFGQTAQQQQSGKNSGIGGLLGTGAALLTPAAPAAASADGLDALFGPL